MLDLYTNIRNRRKELGMTQAELASKVGYSDKSMIAKVEGGKVNLSQAKIFAIASALQTSPSELNGWVVKESPMLQISLKAARVNAGYTLEQAAKECHISVQSMIHYEKGRRLPDYALLRLLSVIYNIPIENISLPEISTKDSSKEKEIN